MSSQSTAHRDGPRKDTVPACLINPPAPADEFLGDYREAESASGVGWNYLAAINLIETHFGSIVAASTAGAQGPMQFLPSTFAAYGAGGDINSPHDSIMAAGRYLAANGFANDRDHANYHYNNANTCGRSTNTQQCLRPIPVRSPTTTGGPSITTRPPETCCSPSGTPRPHRFRSATTCRPTRSNSSRRGLNW